MKHAWVFLSLCPLFLLRPGLAQTLEGTISVESRQFPTLGDVPSLRSVPWGNHGEATRWIRLGRIEGAPSVQPEAGLDLSSRFLSTRIRADVPELRDLSFESRWVRRTRDGRVYEHEGELGVQIVGPPLAVERAAVIADSVVRARESFLIEVRMEILSCAPEATSVEQATVLPSSAEARDLRRKELAALQNANVIAAPSILVRNGQRASITVANTTAYVKDYEVRLVRTTCIADPIIETFSEGIFFEMECFADPAGAGFILDGGLRMAQAARPIKEFKTTLAHAGSEVTIQMPELRESGLKIEDFALPRRGKEAVMVIQGLVMPNHGDPAESTPVEVWCTFTLRARTAENEGTVIAIDAKSGHAFVSFPAALAGDDPANQAPERVSFFNGEAARGRGVRVGGWNLASLADDDRFRRVAIYKISEGDALEGDRAQPSS